MKWALLGEGRFARRPRRRRVAVAQFRYLAASFAGLARDTLPVRTFEE